MEKLLLACMMAFGIGANAQVDLGSGTSATSTSIAVPWSNYYNYSYSQQIVAKSELNASAAGNITGLKFYLASANALTNSDNITVYVGLTTKTAFSSTTDWVAASAMTQVFSGTVTNNNGVVQIDFTTPFAYDNTSNLVIAIDENAAGKDAASTSEYFYKYSGVTNSTLFYRNDTTNPDPAAITSVTGTRSPYHSRMTVLGLTPVAPSCPTVTAPTAAATGTSVTPTFTWSAGTAASSYQISIGTTPGGTDVLNQQNVGNVLTYTLPAANSLGYSTQYYYTINSVNATGTTACATNSFTTKAIPCPTVTAPTASATGVSATPTFTWNAVTGATGYKISVGTTSGGTDVLNSQDVGNVTSYTLSAPLAVATTYYYTISSYAGSATSTGCTVRSFTTACNAANVPYTEDFESVTVPALPACSSSLNAGSGNSWVTSSPASGTFTTKALTYSYNYSNAANAWWFTQGLNLAPNTSYQLKFIYGNSSGTTYPEKLKVAYGTSTTVAGMTTVLADYPNVTNGTTAILVTLNFTTPASANATDVYYIGFNAYSAANMDQLYVDNIDVRLSPTCIEPTAVNVTSVTTNSATVNWTASTTVPGNGYDVYYNTSNTAPTATTTPNITGVTGTTTNITGLTSASTYYVWVRSHCSATDQSAWSTAVNFTTQCDAVATLSENFDTTSSSGQILPTCWSKIVTGLANAYVQASTVMSAPNNLYFYASASTETSIVKLPQISTLSTGNYTIKFNGRANFTAGGKVEVGYMTDPYNAATFVALGTYTAASSSTIDTFTLPITGVPAGVTTLALRHTGSPAYSVLIDNVIYDLTSVLLGTSEVAANKASEKVYPNPFTDFVDISDVKGAVSATVADASGRTVASFAKADARLNLSNLNAGLYILSVTKKDGTVSSFKIIKK